MATKNRIMEVVGYEIGKIDAEAAMTSDIVMTLRRQECPQNNRLLGPVFGKLIISK